MFKVLAVDGGGIRGIIPATLLTHVEAETGKPIAALFDLLASATSRTRRRRFSTNRPPKWPV